MQRYAFALFAICAVAVYAILVLRPDPAVEFEAELSGMEPAEALARLEARDGRVDLTENLRLLQARLATAAGDLDAARAAYEEIIATGSPTARLFDELADVAALSGDLAAAAAFKARAQDMEPQADRRQALGYWYRLLGDEAEETRLLVATAPERLTDFERERLAALLLARGETDAYRDLHMAISETGGEGALAARRRLLELGIDAGRPDEALELALGWFRMEPHRKEGLDASLRTLVGRGALDQAVRLATVAVGTDPEIGPVPVTAFIDTGHGGIGRRLQALWLAGDAGLDGQDWQALVRVAERTGDLTGLREALARASHRRSPDGIAADAPPPATVFLQFLRYQGARALLPYQGAMTSQTFEGAPLVGAAWYGWLRQPTATYDYLLAAAEGPLTDWDRAIWMSVASDLRGTPFFRSLLAGAPRDAGLRELLSRDVRSPVATDARAESSAPTGG
ncbi:hypothetical protein [Rubellimicrobium roseum]|uniref:Tetratricopeptide repeat protein n=1 Tax=Rubellimicrobium roseum TaxID=687525 RepID=A0A5C4NM61_9RHOB|nr:hypothetical protein [Rubellimicrobium roseum]TNC74975.1 hypothetical protein FHG71_02300 [Rubellimicrobium roseum]